MFIRLHGRNFGEPLKTVGPTELFRWECKVVFHVESRWSIQDGIIDTFWVVRRCDGENSFVLSLAPKNAKSINDGKVLNFVTYNSIKFVQEERAHIGLNKGIKIFYDEDTRRIGPRMVENSSDTKLRTLDQVLSSVDNDMMREKGRTYVLSRE